MILATLATLTQKRQCGSKSLVKWTLQSQLVLLTCLFACYSSLSFANIYSPTPESEVRPITIAGKTSHVLVRPWEGKQQFGAMIIIGPSDTEADTTGFTGYLRKQVNPHGWASISLTPPDGLYRPNFVTTEEEVKKSGEETQPTNPETSQQAVTTETPNTTDTTTTEANANQQTSNDGKASTAPSRFNQKPTNQQTARYDAAQLFELRNFQQEKLIEAFNQLDNLGKPFPGGRIIVAMHDSAGIVVHLLLENKIPKPHALILINPYREFEHLIDKANQRVSVAQQIMLMAIPVLELYSPDAHPETLIHIEQSAKYNTVKPTSYYRQYPLSLDLTQPTAWDEALTYIEGFSRKAIKR